MDSSSNNAGNFNVLLRNLLSTENSIRSVAEAKYDEIGDHEKIVLLLSVISNDAVPIEEAELAAVLLRRVVISDSGQAFTSMVVDMQNSIKNQLLVKLQQNINQNLRRKICYVAAEVAQCCMDEEGNNHWPDFLKFLFDSACSPDPFAREIALLMFSSVPGVFGNQQARYIDVIRQMLSQSLADVQFPTVRYVAVKALANFILANEKEVQVQKQFTDCLALLLQFFSQVLDSDDGQPDEILRYLVEVGEVCPQFFRSHLDILLQLCIKGISNADYQDTCRHLSLELIVTLCESAPVMMKKIGSKHIPTVLTCMLKMMTELEDDPDWNKVEEEDTEDDNDSTPVVAEASLDRIACALGGKNVLPFTLTALTQMLQSPDWKAKSAGLMAISAIGEGCNKQMLALLPQIVDGILPFLGDPSPRVRYACCNAMGQMSSDFGPVFQKKFHEKVLPPLLQLLSNQESPKVQAHAGAALVNFFEDIPKYILNAYLQQLVVALETVLNSSYRELVGRGSKLVVEQVVVTLASLADAAQEKFIEYYDRFIPSLKHIIQCSNEPNLLLLRGKTIECVSLIGLAVGKDKFLPDAREIMDLLMKSQTLGDDDPQVSYMIAAWARICKIMGKEFKPYLPYVMESVFKAASIKPEIAVLDAEDMKAVGNDNDWEFVNLGEKHNFGIRTSGLDDKATACQMLVCYARDLKEGFVDYVEETVKLMVPMLKFYFNDSVRIAAGEILPYLLDSAKVRGDGYVQDMWRFILPPLLQALESEPEMDVLCELMDAFSMCISIISVPCFQPEELSNVINILNTYLTRHFERCDAREAKRKEEDYDDVLEDTFEKEDDDDVYLLSKIAQVMSSLLEIYKQDFFNYLDMLLHHFIRLIEPSRPWSDKQWSLCVFADVIEYGGPACSKYQQYFLEPLVCALKDENADLRQTAAFTIGILGQYGGPDFAKFCSDSLPLLIEIINHPDSRSEENEKATENAISAVTKFFMHHSAFTSMEELLPMWLSWLPVWDDEEEAKHVYGFLCTLLETNNTILLGNENANLPRIVAVIAEAFNKDAIDVGSDVGKRLVTLMRDIQSNTEMFSLCVSHLNPKQIEALCSALTAN